MYVQKSAQILEWSQSKHIRGAPTRSRNVASILGALRSLLFPTREVPLRLLTKSSLYKLLTKFKLCIKEAYLLWFFFFTFLLRIFFVSFIHVFNIYYLFIHCCFWAFVHWNKMPEYVLTLLLSLWGYFQFWVLWNTLLWTFLYMAFGIHKKVLILVVCMPRNWISGS